MTRSKESPTQAMKFFKRLKAEAGDRMRTWPIKVAIDDPGRGDARKPEGQATSG